MPEQDGREHGPAIEIYFAGRYFAVTEDRWPGTLDSLATLDAATLDRLAALIPYAKSTKANDQSAADNSRRAIAFRIGLAMRRDDRSYEHSDTRSAAFVAKWGDVSVELDALPLDVLRDRIVREVESWMDLAALARVRDREGNERQ